MAQLGQKNLVIITGMVGKDAAYGFTNKGDPYARFSVSADYRRSEDGGWETVWINCVAFKSWAETVARFLKKGDRILVSGRKTYGEWKGKTTISLTADFILAYNEGGVIYIPSVGDANLSLPAQADSTESRVPKIDAEAFDEDLPF